ncbi:relA-associated inhibitor isoform X1 [Takifugu flavidus]|uniref:relA-associated inhibitor isoform X1 n=1 Tax=Takifugu flavidus TaxID=433684 RepID=UPI002544A3E7|nr:relA-associated inhibitor isoform X1 [Takifugu flavidus]
MSSQTSFGSNMLFQSINDDLNASLATADELSKEFNSLLKEVSSEENTGTQTSPRVSREQPRSISPKVSSPQRTGSDGSSSPQPFSSNSTTYYSSDSISSAKNVPSSPVFTTSPLASPKSQRHARSPLPRAGSDSYQHGQYSPIQAPRSPRHNSPSLSPRGPSPSLSPTALSFGQSSRSATFHPSPNLLNPYDNTQMGRRSPRRERSPSPLSLNHPMSSTLPRNFGFREPDGAQQHKSPSKWNETDLDVSYEKKPHHTYDKTEWVRPTVPSSSWRESDLDGPPPAPSPKKDTRAKALQFSPSSLPRNARISTPPEILSPSHSSYTVQPISRISIPPTSTQARQHRPIPLSVIMRLQNPHWGAMSTRHPRLGGEGDMAAYQPAPPMPREFFKEPFFQPQRHPPELRQPAVYSDALSSGDVDAELERLDSPHKMAVISEHPFTQSEQAVTPAPRPLSPTRLQPMVAPEAQSQEIPDIEELLRIRAEIPRALKRRGSVDQSQPLKKASHYQPNQYKTLIDKLFRKKERRSRGEQGSDASSSSEGEECAMPPSFTPKKSTVIPQEVRSYNSILRRPKKERKSSGKRARLSPHVLALDGALHGELETVQKAVQEMTDPSQPNDEGITALHNAICGGHYNVVDFLVRIGANVSAPDSHGWTPLHCAASCNDRLLCEFLVRNGGAVMAMTESDGATASQKCDPYAVGFEECENFLRGMEEAMGLENSGVLYALWSYPAQAPDELSFKDGDMVTILQKPEGSDWWWASLCGREGFVPNNYFGLFPKVRPKTLC